MRKSHQQESSSFQFHTCGSIGTLWRLFVHSCLKTEKKKFQRRSKLKRLVELRDLFLVEVQHVVMVNLVDWREDDQFICKVASTVEEAKTLVERGFEYITEVIGVKLFRKRR